MFDRRLLIAALVLVTAGLIGMGLQGTATGSWGMHPGSMMSWWGDTGARSDLQPSDPTAPSIEVEANEFAFRPDRVVIEAGTTLNLTLVNHGRLVHDLSIPELELQLVAPPGQTATTALRVSEPGEYEVLCTVPGHAQAGMVGSIVVRSP